MKSIDTKALEHAIYWFMSCSTCPKDVKIKCLAAKVRVDCHKEIMAHFRRQARAR